MKIPKHTLAMTAIFILKQYWENERTPGHISFTTPQNVKQTQMCFYIVYCTIQSRYDCTSIQQHAVFSSLLFSCFAWFCLISASCYENVLIFWNWRRLSQCDHICVLYVFILGIYPHMLKHIEIILEMKHCVSSASMHTQRTLLHVYDLLRIRILCPTIHSGFHNDASH